MGDVRGYRRFIQVDLFDLNRLSAVDPFVLRLYSSGMMSDVDLVFQSFRVSEFQSFRVLEF